MRKPICLLLLILLIALNIIFYNVENSKIINIIQFFIEITALLSFAFVLLNLEKSPYTKWIQIMTIGLFISLFRWWRTSFVTEKFLSAYIPDLYSQYGEYFVVVLILTGGGLIINKLDLFKKSNL